MNSGSSPSKPASTSREDVGENADLTDEALVEKARHGDLSAFDALVVRHREKLFAMIRGMVNSEADAWDLSQDAFVKAWSALSGFKGDSGFYTWLYRIARNVVYDWLRKLRNRATILQFETTAGEAPEVFAAEDAPTVPKAEESPDRALERADLRRILNEALAKLSDEHREVIWLREIEGLSYPEIAERAGCSQGTVMSRLFYARKKLQELLRFSKF